MSINYAKKLPALKKAAHRKNQVIARLRAVAIRPPLPRCIKENGFPRRFAPRNDSGSVSRCHGENADLCYLFCNAFVTRNMIKSHIEGICPGGFAKKFHSSFVIPNLPVECIAAGNGMRNVMPGRGTVKVNRKITTIWV